MKFIILVLALFSMNAKAAVTAKFAGSTGMISILDYALSGQKDDDPHRLFSLIDRPLKQEPGYGYGKTVGTSDRKFLLSCNAGSEIHKHCAVVVRAGPWTQLSPQLGMIRFVTAGPEAAELARAIFREDEGSYESGDGRLQIQAWEGFFILNFKNELQ